MLLLRVTRLMRPSEGVAIAEGVTDSINRDKVLCLGRW